MASICELPGVEKMCPKCDKGELVSNIRYKWRCGMHVQPCMLFVSINEEAFKRCWVSAFTCLFAHV